MTTFSRRLAAFVAAGALTFGGTFVDMPAASAQAGTETAPTTAAPAPTGTIDPAHAVSLTINKYLGEPGNTSTAVPDSPQVKFKIEKVSGVDLTTQAGWETLAGLTAANAPIDSGFTAVELPITGGKATISTGTNPQFTVGVYKVTELNTAGYTTAAPFLVTLPFNDATTGSWNYDQVVNPKNQDVQPNKQADDSQAMLGGTMTYTINAPVPAGAMDRFNIVDPMQTGLTLNAGSAVVTATGATPPTFVPADYTITETGNTLRVDFTRAGLDKLEAARKTDPTLQVSVKFTAKVSSIPANGVIINTATVELPNGATVTTDVPVNGSNPSGPTSTTYGNLTITKTGGTAVEMNGAQFQVYQCQETGPSTGKYQLLGEPLSIATDVNGTATDNTLTTTNDTANGYGLPASSFSGGATGTVPNTYCVLETKAPAGFVRDPEPRVLTYAAGTNAPGTFTVSVNNVKDSILGQLPATGAWGIVLIFIIGGALLARGLYTSYKDNRANA